MTASGVFSGGGLALWRAADCGEWKATAADIASDLDVLQVPHQVVRAFRYPLSKSWDKRPRRGEEVRIARKDLPHLLPWMPSIQQWIDHITDEWPGFAFTIFEPRAEGMAVLQLPFAADWPRWTPRQAASMALMCAECGHDLRDRQNGDRLPYNIPLPKQPTKRRLVCGRCCNDGLDELERLAALAGAP
ncbi:hypothetical protein [Streptomyces sp. NPDC101393]|uniref:hypothetical protein n=1 Tax=Streptomyces sp. NPDC101393 TaxID=3366141 RepID=UPI0038303125